MSGNRLLDSVIANKRTLFYAHALGHVVYVRKYPKGDIFHHPGEPFSAWAGGCGIGHHKTFEGAKKTCLDYLKQRVVHDRDGAKKMVEEAEAYLKNPEQAQKDVR